MALSSEGLRELSLFSGGGGGLLGSILLGFRPVCYVEREPYAVEVIKARIRDGYLHDAPIWDDVRTFDGRPWAGRVDIVTGGFPCQPFSAAGQQQGADDERNCWPDTIRIIRDVGPEWCLLENVATLITFDYFGQILGDLADSGFDIRWDVVSACSVGAPHTRERLFIEAHARSQRWFRGRQCEVGRQSAKRGKTLIRSEHPNTCERPTQAQVWSAGESDILRVADGVGSKLDRLRAIGNGQVPAVVRAAWQALSAEL